MAVLTWLVAAGVVWWRARAGGAFYIVGWEGEWSAALGPLLPALCAGLSVAFVLSLVDAASGVVAGVVAAAVMILLPGFLPLHSASLVGPPLLALSLGMLAVMLHAPRFSIAYGTLAAVAAVYWAALSGGHAKSPVRRITFAVIPLIVIVVLSRLTGDGWPLGGVLAWRGGLDGAFRAAGSVIGDQLAPGIANPALRWFAIADLSLLLLAVVVVAWRRVPEGGLVRRLYPASGVVAAAYAVGLAAHTMLLSRVSEPNLASVFPLVAIAVIVIAASAGILWRGWHTTGKALAILLLIGWAQAALRG